VSSDVIDRVLELLLILTLNY